MQHVKNISHVHTSRFALKSNLASLKTKVNKLGIDELVPVPVYLSKLSDVVKNHINKKIVHDKLLEKVNNINTSGFVLNTKYDTDKSELQKKIPDTSGLVKNTDYGAKIKWNKKIPTISGLATNFSLTAVENKTSSLLVWLKKPTITQKSVKLKRKLLIIIMKNILILLTLEFDKLSAEVFDARLAQANSVTKVLMINLKWKIKKINKKKNAQTKRNIYLFKMNLKNIKQLIRFNLDAKAILKKMVHKII